MKHVVIDIETTGRSSSAKMIEFSALKYEDNTLVDEYTTLINPMTKIPASIVETTGITDEMVSKAPTINEVLGKIIGAIRDQTVIGYNVTGFALPRIRTMAEQFGISFDAKAIDLLYAARRATPELPDHKLTTVAEHFGIDTTGRHRTRKDCLIIQELYNHIYEYVYDKKPKATRERHTYEDIEKVGIQLSNIEGSNFVLTGDFESGSKDQIAYKISEAGGVVKSGVSSKVNYVVVGGMGSANWKFGNQGGKIKKAKELQEAGIDIKIISESELMDLL